MTPSIDTWEVFVVDDLDPRILNLVSEFFNENFPGVFSGTCKPEIFQWKLGDNNPAGRGFLTVAMAKGHVIGTTTATARIIKNGEIPVVALEIGDTFTHPDWRKSGICVSSSKHLAWPDDYFDKSVFGRLVLETIYRARLKGYSFIFGTPNLNSFPPYIKRLQFQEINQGVVFNNLSIGKNYGNLKNVLKIYGKTTYIFHKVKNNLRNSPIKILESDINLPIRNESINTGVGLVLQSDFEWIKHRYVDHPNNKYRFFTVTIGKHIQGLIVATALVRPSGFRSLIISEFWSEQTTFSGYMKEISILLQEGFSNIEVISFWSIPNQRRRLFQRNIKIIALNLDSVAEARELRFRKFHMGWSDNG